jgi:hypothetical protein
MANNRKKKDTEIQTGESPSESHETAVAVLEGPEIPLALPVEQPATQPVHANGNGHHANGNGARRPDVSWKLSSDRTTSIEVSAWVNEYTNNQTGESYEQVTFSIQRSYRDANNVWARGGSWRTHDVPILQFLLTKAHGWALERRMTDSSCPI